MVISELIFISNSSIILKIICIYYLVARFFSIICHEQIFHLPAEILKIVSVLISYTFEIIFNKSIENVIYPNLLKCAWVTPIYKSGERSEASNYRPINKLLSFNKFLNGLKGLLIR